MRLSEPGFTKSWFRQWQLKARSHMVVGTLRVPHTKRTEGGRHAERACYLIGITTSGHNMMGWGLIFTIVWTISVCFQLSFQVFPIFLWVMCRIVTHKKIIFGCSKGAAPAGRQVYRKRFPNHHKPQRGSMRVWHAAWGVSVKILLVSRCSINQPIAQEL